MWQEWLSLLVLVCPKTVCGSRLTPQFSLRYSLKAPVFFVSVHSGLLLAPTVPKPGAACLLFLSVRAGTPPLIGLLTGLVRECPGLRTKAVPVVSFLGRAATACFSLLTPYPTVALLYLVYWTAGWMGMVG